MAHATATIAVEVADPAGRHLTTIDGFASIEEAVEYLTTVRPGSHVYAGDAVHYFTKDGRTTGAELRHPIDGTLTVQLLAHPDGWVPAR